MKRDKAWMIALTILMLMGVLAGCSGSAAGDPGNNTGGGTGDIPEVVKAALGDKAPTGRLKVILEKGEIRMGTSPDFPPSEFLDLTKEGDEAYQGCDIELGRYIAKQLGVKLIITDTVFDAVLANIAEGIVDMGISGLAIRPDRMERMYFTKDYQGVTDGYQGLMIRKEDQDLYHSFSDFSGKTVGVQNGSLQQELCTANMPDVEQKLIANLGDAVMMLQSKSVDALVMASTTGEGFINNYSDLMMIETLPLPVTSEGAGIGVTKKDDVEDLLTVLNYIIDDVTAKGLYNEWRAAAIELNKSLQLD